MPHHLLIADDEPSVLGFLRLFFERLGYRVSAATNGQEALDLALTLLPDACIFDIQMPHKTGVEVAEALRGDPRFATTPLIAMTAHVRDFALPMILRAGFDQLVTKPFELAELQEAVVTQLAKKH